MNSPKNPLQNHSPSSLPWKLDKDGKIDRSDVDNIRLALVNMSAHWQLDDQTVTLRLVFDNRELHGETLYDQLGVLRLWIHENYGFLPSKSLLRDILVSLGLIPKRREERR